MKNYIFFKSSIYLINVFRKGEIDIEMYWIIEGKADIIENEEVMKTLKRNDFFGENSIL